MNLIKTFFVEMLKNSPLMHWPRAAADDKKAPMARVFTGPGQSGLFNRGDVGSTRFKNFIYSMALPFKDTVSGKFFADAIYTRVSPVGDTDYASMPIGSVCFQLTVSATAVTTATIWLKVGATAWDAIGGQAVIDDPGDATAIPVTGSGNITLVTTGAQTRTLAIPSYKGQRLSISMGTDAGDCVVTVASAFDQNGNTIITFNDVGDYIALEGVVSTGTTLAWRIVARDGALVANTSHVGLMVADPGDGNAIVVTQSGTCELVSAGAETRTLAIPTFAGQRLDLVHKTDAGDIVLTVASAFDEFGSTKVTFNDQGDMVSLVGIYSGANLAWRVIANEGGLVANTTYIGEMVADPGDGLAITVNKSGVCELVSGGAETRTLAIPTFAGQRLTIAMNTDGGDVVTTVAQTFDLIGHTTITHNAVGDTISLIGIYVSGALRWRVESNDGCLLGSAAGFGDVIADVGTGNAIPVTHKHVSMPITTAGAETNTLAIPTQIGQTMSLWADTYSGGDRVITAASAINAANNTVMTFGVVSDAIELKAVSVGGTLAWQVVANDGVALS